MNLKYFPVLICILCCSSLFAQIADFPFNTNINDIVNGYNPTANGNPSIITDGLNQVLELEGDEYLIMPDQLHESLDINQDVEVQIRFKITDIYDGDPDPNTGQFGLEGKRILVSNKVNLIADLGFNISVSEMDGEYRLLMSFGDNSFEGEWIFNDVIEEDEWVDLKLIMRLNNESPNVVYKLNGIYRHFPISFIDAEIFKTSLNTQQIWLGTDQDNNEGTLEYAFAKTSIDYFKIYNPVFVGDISTFTSALNSLTAHVDGSVTLSQTQQEDLLNTIVNEWDDNIQTIFNSDIMNYINAYEAAFGSVFQFYAQYIDPAELSVPRTLQFMFIQYAIDNLYSNANVANMDGISFMDHTLLPGIVSPAAPRVNQSVNVDGDFNTDPGYYLNQQDFVIRPTGFYAAPGEIVEVSVPASLINQGVKIRVGAHAPDLRLDNRGFHRFPTIATNFQVNSNIVSVANPMGGAIYILFPDGSNFGSTMLQFDNAVKSPYYSTKTGFSNALSTYQADLNNAYVNWVDVESDNFMATFPRALAEMFPDPNAYLNPLNDIIATFNVVAGRPASRIRSEYILSEPQSYTQGTLPASYPMSIVNGDLSEADPFSLPVSALDPYIYMETYDGSTMIHELGHLHNMPTIDDELETNIDIPTVMAFNVVFGVSLDTALYYAPGFQRLTRDQAALDWILDPKFRRNIASRYDDVSYQARGIAKYVDVAALLSWDSLGLIHQYWYDLALQAPDPANGIEFVSADEYIQVASDQLGFNFAPLWELWGSIPSTSLVNQLDAYDKENRIKERILYYRSLVPSNAAEFLNTYNSITPNLEDHHVERYDEALAVYDEQVADSILVRIDDILCKYFDTNCNLTSIDLFLEQDAISLLPNPTTGLVEIVGSLKDYNIKVMAPDGSIVKEINCSGHSYFINLSELPSGLFFIQVVNDNNAQVCLKKIIKQ